MQLQLDLTATRISKVESPSGLGSKQSSVDSTCSSTIGCSPDNTEITGKRIRKKKLMFDEEIDG